MAERTRAQDFKIGDRVGYSAHGRFGTVTGIDTSQEWRQVQVQWDPVPDIEWCNPMQLVIADRQSGSTP